MKSAAMLRPFLAAMAAFFCLAGPVLADTAIDPAFDRFKATLTGNTVDVRFSTTGVPLANPGGPLTSTGSGGAGFLSRSASVATQYGPLPFTVSQRFGISSLAKGAAAIALNPVVGIGLAIAVPYIYDWFTDSGMVVSEDGSVRSTSNPSAYNIQTPYGTFYGSSPAAACSSMTSYFGGGYWDGGSYCYRPNGNGYLIRSSGTGGSYISEPLTAAQVQTALQSTSRTDSEIERILSEGIEFPELVPDPADKPQVLNPQPSPSRGSSSTSIDPATGTTTQTRSCSMIGSPSTSGDQLTVSEICTTSTTTTPPAGSPTTVQGTTTTGIGVTVGSGQPSESEPFEMPCGVASAPPCAVKVDETGTVQTVPELANPEELAQQPLTPYEQLKNDPSGFWPTLPTMNWSFALPTGCGVISVPGFAPFLESIDICPWQSLFHEIMTVVWVLGGLFGAVSTFWRNTFATV